MTQPGAAQKQAAELPRSIEHWDPTIENVTGSRTRQPLRTMVVDQLLHTQSRTRMPVAFEVEFEVELAVEYWARENQRVVRTKPDPSLDSDPSPIHEVEMHRKGSRLGLSPLEIVVPRIAAAVSCAIMIEAMVAVPIEIVLLQGGTNRRLEQVLAVHRHHWQLGQDPEWDRKKDKKSTEGGEVRSKILSQDASIPFET